MSIGTFISLYESLLKSDRPAAWWGMDAADPLEDDSGWGHPLTASPTAAAGAASLLSRGDDGESGSLDFNGSNDGYVTADVDPFFIEDDFACHVILRPDTVSGTDTIIYHYYGSNIICGLHMFNGQLQFFYDTTAAAGGSFTVTGPTLSAGNTYHVVVSDNGTTHVHFWVNGVKTSVARPNATAYFVGSPPYKFVIGCEAAGTNLYDGKMDELAVWDVQITDDMVATWYEAYSEGTFGEAHVAGPRVKLEVAWKSAPAYNYSYSWYDMTSFCQGAATSRGRNFEIDRMETGRMDFELSNLGGEFEPDNIDSPYYPFVIPTRAVRLRAQTEVDGPAYPLFFGYTEGHPIVRPASGFDSRARFVAADAMKAMSMNKITDSTVRGAELSGARIAAVLNEPSTLYLGSILDGGVATVAGDDLQDENQLDHIQQVAYTDGGVVFCDAWGIILFQDRDYRLEQESTVRATYGNGGGSELPFTSLEPEVDEARLFTTAVVTPPSGNAQVAENVYAVEQHWKRTKDVQTLHNVDADALEHAEYLVDLLSIPRLVVPGFELRPKTTDAWSTALGHELSHRIATVDRPLGADAITREHFIERLEHSISTGDWRIKVGVSRAPPPFPSTDILDTFNRANTGPPPSASWSAYVGVGLKVVSNELAPHSTTDNGASWNTSMTSPNVEAYLDVRVLPIADAYMYIRVRDDLAGTWYALAHRGVAGTDQLIMFGSYAGATYTIDTWNQDLAVGDAFGIRAVGSQLEAWVRLSGTWSRLDTVVDTVNLGTGSNNKLSLYHYGNGGTTGRWDNFGGGVMTSV